MNKKIIVLLVFLVVVLAGFYFWTKRQDLKEYKMDGVLKSKIDTSQILSGGPPKDGIPSIDKPKFWNVGEANKFLKDDDVVFGLEFEGEVRAYPLRILNWHEIVNDSVAGKPVLITYCPLCYTGIAFKREINGIPVEFGVSGKLYNSNLLMYNRPNGQIKEESLWSQQLGEAVVGPLTGTKLTQIVLDALRWGDWKAKHPDTKALSTDTGHFRNYNVNPYGDYEFSSSIFFPVTAQDSRLPPKEKIYGIELDGKFKAYPQDKLKRGASFIDNFAGKTIKIFVDDIGKIRMIDTKTKDEIPWQISFWFSWVAFHPESEIY